MMPDFSPWNGAENLEIAMTALSHSSPTMKYAGARNFSPISFFGGLNVGRSHWAMYEEGQRESGLTPDRSRFRMCRDIVVADTDKEAKRIALEGASATAGRSTWFPSTRSSTSSRATSTTPAAPST
jgi:alkanesulfonate monooxygenase SsuD/methylene tetrahydromethanopterin reductase-like flavin-dependent oxidoreductase (luciferase family)